jgi:ferrous iron transport protein A
MEHQAASQPNVGIVLVTLGPQAQYNEAPPPAPDVSPNESGSSITQTLVQAVQTFTNGSPVSIGLAQLEPEKVTETVEQAISQGAQRVVVVPATLIRTSETEQELPQLIDRLQQRHTDVDMIYVYPPFDLEQQAKLILDNIREHLPKRLAVSTERLSTLSAGAKAVVVKLIGGHDMLSRMATLGFTPGAEVTVVQNFGHGPLIVSVRDARIALGRGEASKICVRQLGESEQPGRHRTHKNGWHWLHSAIQAPAWDKHEPALNGGRHRRGWGWLHSAFELARRKGAKRGWWRDHSKD